MCGISGEVNFGKTGMSLEDVKNMCSLLVHRGPDEDGYYFSKHAVLGIRRLKVIGITNGSQPVYNHSHTAVCVFNGEIYNYCEIKSFLEKEGYIFKTKTDAEVIIHLYDKIGFKFVNYLRGMFAIAIYDERANQLILTRDRVGKKPLNYSVASNGTVIFSSELNSLISHPLVKCDINFEAVDRFLSFRIIPAPLTIYKNIFKVEPGTLLIFKENKKIEHRYWNFDFSEGHHEQSWKFLVKTVKDFMIEAVEIRLNSEVPLGALLSGGLDSSLVVSIMSKLLNRPIHTFSIGFENKDFNEFYFAKLVSEYCHTIHHEYLITPDLVLRVMDQILTHFGEPFAFPSVFACYFMNYWAKKFVTVVLSGDGSDEIFCGYNRYKIFYDFPQLPTRSDFLSKIDLELFENAFGDISVEYQSILTDGIRNSLKKQLYSKKIIDKIPGVFPNNYLSERFAKNTGLRNRLNRVMEVDCNFWLRDAQLVKIDIASMANSVEIRCPMLDHKLIELVSSIAPKHKLFKNNEKYILKKVAEDFLPQKIIQRSKQELAVPLESWLTTSLRQEVSKTLLSENSLSRGYFNPDKMTEFVHNYKACDSYAIWTLYILEKWFNIYENLL